MHGRSPSRILYDHHQVYKPKWRQFFSNISQLADLISKDGFCVVLHRYFFGGAELYSTLIGFKCKTLGKGNRNFGFVYMVYYRHGCGLILAVMTLSSGKYMIGPVVTMRFPRNLALGIGKARTYAQRCLNSNCILFHPLTFAILTSPDAIGVEVGKA